MSKTRRNKKPKGLLKAVEKLRLKFGERTDKHGFRQRKGGAQIERQEPVVMYLD